MKIGIDIDEVVVEYVKRFLELCETNLNQKFSIAEISNFNMEEVLGISKEEADKIAKEFNDCQLFKELDFVEGAKESISILSKDNELFFITSRPSSIIEGTRDFLNKHLKVVDFEIYHSLGFRDGEGKTKADICKERGIKILIEDRRKYALDCAENGIKVFLMDKPWNQNCGHENIIRVKNWKEILERLNGN